MHQPKENPETHSLRRTIWHGLRPLLETGDRLTGGRLRNLARQSLRRLRDAGAIRGPRRSLISSRPELPGGPAMPRPVVERLAELMLLANCYLEYGAGGSTVEAVKLEVPTILAVESDALWLETVRHRIAKLASSSQYHLIHVDIGPTGEWGRPTSEAHWRSYRHYALDAWDICQSKNVVPDLILIDGRFRVACFLASLLFGKAGCRILIDDYTTRPEYAGVEQFVVPVQIIDRAAEFTIPYELSRDQIWHALLAAVTDPR